MNRRDAGENAAQWNETPVWIGRDSGARPRTEEVAVQRILRLGKPMCDAEAKAAPETSDASHVRAQTGTGTGHCPCCGECTPVRWGKNGGSTRVVFCALKQLCTRNRHAAQNDPGTTNFVSLVPEASRSTESFKLKFLRVRRPRFVSYVAQGAWVSSRAVTMRTTHSGFSRHTVRSALPASVEFRERPGAPVRVTLLSEGHTVSVWHSPCYRIRAKPMRR